MSKELRKTIIEVFRKFSMDPHHSPLKKQKDREIAGRFIDRLHTTTFDSGSLPYYSPNGLAKHTNKAECVLAMMCDIVLNYWAIIQWGDNVTENAIQQLNGKLKQLGAVYRTYEQLKVLGDEKGYCLLKSLRKDLYEKPEVKAKEEIVEKIDNATESGEEEIKRCGACEGSGLEHDEHGFEVDDVCDDCTGSGTAVGEGE